MTLCSCGSGSSYLDCCGMYITGKSSPKTPESLMRSRYTAYTEANIDYITKTMKDKAAKGFDAIEAKAWAKGVTWEGLEVLNSRQEQNEGWVEFIAHYSIQGNHIDLHEVSHFRLENEQWFYVDGKTMPEASNKVPKAGRNDSCPCGSHKKFKKCCGV